MHNPIDAKSREYYEEAFKTEAKGKLDFYKKDIETHNRNIKRLAADLEEENTAKRASEAEIALIEERLGDIDKEAKRLFFRDFRAAVSDILSGQESQSGGRYGLRIEKQGPFRIEKPVSISEGGKRRTEMCEVSIMKYRNNEEALVRFQDYMRKAGNIAYSDITFDELKNEIEKFFRDAPRPDVYGDVYEVETPARDIETDLYNRFEQAKSGNSLFKM